MRHQDLKVGQAYTWRYYDARRNPEPPTRVYVVVGVEVIQGRRSIMVAQGDLSQHPTIEWKPVTFHSGTDLAPAPAPLDEWKARYDAWVERGQARRRHIDTLREALRDALVTLGFDGEVSALKRIPLDPNGASLQAYADPLYDRIILTVHVSNDVSASPVRLRALLEAITEGAARPGGAQ